jgi:circadian clock protein KaiC
MRPLVKTCVRGIDEEILRGGIPQGHVVLLRGSSGTMKSSLAYSVLYHNALEGVPGLYITLEQTAASILEQMASLGFRATSAQRSLPIFDVSRGREHLLETASKLESASASSMPRGEALLALLKGKILDLRNRYKFDLLAIDSWDALELVLDFQDPRVETFAFFEWLRDQGFTSLLISEEPDSDSETVLEEEFLADGVLHLMMVPVTEASYQRRLQCTKMRSVNHSTDEHTLLFDNGRFEVARAIG